MRLPGSGRQASTPPRPKRWGLRTLAFLAIALAATLTSNHFVATGNNDYVLLTFAGQVGGLIGAAICSVRGLRSMRGFPRD